MKIFYSPVHAGHAPREEFEAGRLTPAVEVPARAEAVRARIAARGIGEILAPAEFGNEPALRVHDASFVHFLREAHGAWAKDYPEVDAIPSVFPMRGFRERRDGGIVSRLGSYTFDTGTPLTRGTWEAAHAAVNTALSAAREVKTGARAAFALTRPPGHHASADLFGGYCYLNNVAIAAQWLTDAGARCAVLDVDYHHGNGTQAIFYGRADVLTVSLHADPSFAYPLYSGFADERGEGGGEGFNLNLALPRDTDWPRYAEALAAASHRLREFAPDIVLVSLGLDTFRGDPIGGFALETADYLKLGAAIAALQLPVLFVFEGGYNLEHLAENTVNVLEGFQGV